MEIGLMETIGCYSNTAEKLKPVLSITCQQGLLAERT